MEPYIVPRLLVRLGEMSEEEQLKLLYSLSNPSEPLPPGTPIEELLPFMGMWGEEQGREIAEIIERDCEQSPEY
jgi:hypothetical protein